MPHNAISYGLRNRLCYETEYRYEAVQKQCKSETCNYAPGLTHNRHNGASDSTLKSVIAQAPVSICVPASKWSNYGGGVFSDDGDKKMNHAVVAVGYDTSASIPYWLVRNSWGTSWGEGGHIKIKMGTHQVNAFVDNVQ